MGPDEVLERAAELIGGSTHATAFTGAGISVESGIPPFRGEDGVWSRLDPGFLDISFFREHPERSWPLIVETFYDVFRGAEPNAAHRSLAAMEARGLVEAVVTQNIDGLHRRAGSQRVIEFHGSSDRLVCTECGATVPASDDALSKLPPLCPGCSGVLRPDFVFFGEPIPEPASTMAFAEAEVADVFLLVGTTGMVQPASSIPVLAKANGAVIVEVNTEATAYTGTITDVFVPGPASRTLPRLEDLTSG